MSFPRPLYRWRPHPWHGLEAGSDDDLPHVVLERLRHYFMTYKLVPGDESGVTIGEPYSRDHALEVVEASLDDYREEFGE